MRRWIVRCAIAVVVLIAAVEITWLVGGNWFLRTQLPGMLNGDPQRTLVTWTSIDRLFLPGRAKASGFRIRAQNAQVQWETRLTEARGRISLLPLLWRKCRIVGLAGEQCSVRLRFIPGAGAGAEVGSMDAPPIEGFPGPPVTADQALPPAPERTRWTFELRRCHLGSLNEIWLGSFRFTGTASARASLQVAPGSWITARKFELDLGKGDVSVGDDLFASALVGELSCHVDYFDMEGRPALDVLEELSARASLRAQLHDVQLPRARFPNVPWLGFGGSVGDGSLKVVLEDGALAEGSSLRFAAKDFEVAYPMNVVRGRARVEGHVEREHGRALGRVEARFSGFEIRRENAPEAHVRGDGFSARLETEDLTLRHPLETFAVNLTLPESEIADFTSYDEAIPKPLRVHVESGAGTIAGHLDVTERGGTGAVDLKAHDLLLTYMGERLRGDFDLATAIRSADMRSLAFDLEGTTAKIRNGSSEDAGKKAEGWWADVAFPRFLLDHRDAVYTDLHADVKMRDSRPFVALVVADHPMVKLVRPALVAENIVASADLRAGPDLVDLDDARLEGEGLLVRSCADLTVDDRRGVVLVDSGILSAGVRFGGGERHVKPFAGERWYDEHAPECNGSADVPAQ